MNDGMYLEDFIDEYYDLEDEEDICDLLEGLSLSDGITDLLEDIEDERDLQKRNSNKSEKRRDVSISPFF